GDRIVVLEGGYGWFKALRNRGYDDVFTIFITLFSEEQIIVRGRNTEWIDANFNQQERFLAHCALNYFIATQGGEDHKGGEIDLEKNPTFKEKIKAYVFSVKKLIFDKALMDGPLLNYLSLFAKSDIYKATENAIYNSVIIETNIFIEEFNKLLREFGEDQYQLDPGHPDYNAKVAQIKALAYEVERRLSSREKSQKFNWNSTYKRDPGYIRLNRVLEGTVQVYLAVFMHNTRKLNGDHHYNYVIENPWIYDEDKIESKLSEKAEEFARPFLLHLVLAMREKVVLSRLPNDEFIGVEKALGLMKKRLELQGNVPDTWIETMFDLRPWPSKKEQTLIVGFNNANRIERRIDEIERSYRLLSFLAREENKGIPGAFLIYRPYTFIQTGKESFNRVVEVVFLGQSGKELNEIFSPLDVFKTERISKFDEEAADYSGVFKTHKNHLTKMNFGNRIFLFAGAENENTVVNRMQELTSKFKDEYPDYKIFTINDNGIQTCSSPIGAVVAIWSSSAIVNNVKTVAFITPEAKPFFFTGGLGDVGGELPMALSDNGLNVYIFTYKYDAIDPGLLEDTGVTCMTNVEYRNLPTKIWTAKSGKVTYIFLDIEGRFKEAYAGDRVNFANGLADGTFRAIEALVAAGKMPNPQLLHANDWPASLVPLFLNTKYNQHPLFKDTASVFTIHNPKHIADWIPGNRFPELGISGEHWFSLVQPNSPDYFCLMRGAVYHAHKFNAVSRNNRNEMLTPEGGIILYQDYQARVADFLGINNGIYYPVWEPISLREKPAKKAAIQEKLGFKVDKNIPLFGMVARIASQKGVRQVVRVIDRMLRETNAGIQFIYLGKGNAQDSYAAEVSEELKQLQNRWPNNVRFMPKYTTV
ncbi:MAG: glycogen/starch synthase, partial [Candidatus Omnitrophica bacterium]|nr:glycogen/starch synthase [Candidatus Omnitrophota bacterium]